MLQIEAYLAIGNHDSRSAMMLIVKAIETDAVSFGNSKV
jgi:hypothetical protein